ncbi:hypothetical protein [Asticcacaulis sp. AC402]|uniref:hypothetical protein n=1 Tax=Asticcacaulis sp. AC402 TaxID=1282361 RepID=UPI0003C3B795|nr:hypothetical protein [Asticcacaulis sp. AC402]ESQ74375.1 hypothetical protein ABAC402_14690 [Asticcacaulis sp. AC402]
MTCRNALLTCLALAAATPVMAQDPATRDIILEIPATGEIRLKVERTMTKSGQGPVTSMTMAYDIVDSYVCVDDSCTIASKVENAVFKTMNGQVPPKGVDMSPLTEVVRLMDGVSYSADSSFSPLRLNGLTQLKENYVRTMMVTLGTGADEKTRASPEFRTNITMAVDQMLMAVGGEEAAPAFAAERELLSWAHNTSLPLGEAVSATMEFASPVDGTPLPALLSMTLESVDETKGLAVITFDKTPDEAAMTAYVRQVAPRMLAQVGAPAEAQEISVKGSTHCRFEVSLKTGLVNTADCRVEKGVTVAGKGEVTMDHYVMSEALLP